MSTSKMGFGGKRCPTALALLATTSLALLLLLVGGGWSPSTPIVGIARPATGTSKKLSACCTSIAALSPATPKKSPFRSN